MEKETGNTPLIYYNDTMCLGIFRVVLVTPRKVDSTRRMHSLLGGYVAGITLFYTNAFMLYSLSDI